MTRIKSCNVNLGSSVVIGEFQSNELKQHEEQKQREEERKREEENARVEKLMAEALAEAEEKANQILEDAQSDAALLIEKAHTEKAQVEAELEQMKQNAVDTGYKQGFDSGYEEGSAKIREEMQEKIDAVDFFAGSNFEIKNKILNSAQGDMLNLCLKICEKVCEKSLDAPVLEKIIEKALAALKSKTVVSIMISPNLAAKLEPDFDKKFKNVRIVENPKIADDSIIVESLSGNIDCSIEAQIEKIAGELLNA